MELNSLKHISTYINSVHGTVRSRTEKKESQNRYVARLQTCLIYEHVIKGTYMYPVLQVGVWYMHVLRATLHSSFM